jgi:hypothetical protein
MSAVTLNSVAPAAEAPNLAAVGVDLEKMPVEAVLAYFGVRPDRGLSKH